MTKGETMTDKQKMQIKLDLTDILERDMGTISRSLDISLIAADYLALLISNKLSELNQWD